MCVAADDLRPLQQVYRDEATKWLSRTGAEGCRIFRLVISCEGHGERLGEESAGRGAADTKGQTMRVMVIVKATEESEAGGMPSLELMQEMGRFNEALFEAGLMKGGEGLKPSSQGCRVAFDGEARSVSPGPFAATSELVAGFWIWEVKDMDEAIAWVKRCPNPMSGPSEIEIRPLFETEECGDAIPEEIVESERRMRESIKAG